MSMEQAIFWAIVALCFQVALTASIRLTVYRLAIVVPGHSWHRAALPALFITLLAATTFFWLSLTLDSAFLGRYGSVLGYVLAALFFVVPYKVAYRLTWARAYWTGALSFVGCVMFLTPVMAVAAVLLHENTVVGMVAAGVFALILLALVGRSWRQESRFLAE
jgi:hypothetical protein